MSLALVWLRRDLRRRDNPALLEATRAADDVAPVWVVDPTVWSGAGPARRAWLAATLRRTREDWQERLTVLHGDPREVVPGHAARLGATSVHVTAETTPYGRRRDRDVAARLERHGVVWRAHGTPYATAPGTLTTGSGTPYRVFTPFARTWGEHGWPDPAPTVRLDRLLPGEEDPQATERIEAALAEGPERLPTPGEDAAWRRWQTFRDQMMSGYDESRDRPDTDGTSRLSPYLRLGVLHPRSLLADLAGVESPGATAFRTELAWREFYADVLWHHPRSAWQDLTGALAGMRYDEPGDADDPHDAVAAWRTGRTGFPVVDAGMRQLLATGWMHNRVRMVTASFLTKDLHVWWPVGARHFLDHLIDGDLASNNHGWQWVAGTGTDAAPYFRVFNPVTQGKRFDPEGAYVRRWVPELAHLPGAAAHEPWRHEDGYAHGYPAPLVEHAAERREALARYEAARG